MAFALILGSCNMAVSAQPLASPDNGSAPASSDAKGMGTAEKPGPVWLDGLAIQGGVLKGAVASTKPLAALSLDGEPVEVAEDGSFIIAFNRDAATRAELVARFADGQVVDRTLDVAPREWRIEYVNASPSGSAPSAAFLELRRPELQAIGAARQIKSDSQGWRQRFIWPVKGRISGVFGSQRVYRGEPGSYHSGVDVSTGTSGTPIVAPADGVVILAADKPFTLEGNLLMIDHGMGLNSAFLHLSEISVKPGDTVRQGQVIGRIGATGRATGPHLHWSMKWNEARIDPMLLAGPMEP